MATTSNLWLGYSSIDFANVVEKNLIQVSNVDHYLNNVEYVVDIHLTKSSLSKMLSDVCITYASNNIVDFQKTLLPDGTSTDISNVFTLQKNNGKSFNIKKGEEVIGRMPATLRGKYAQHVNEGADNIKLNLGDYPIISNVDGMNTFLPLFYDENGVQSIYHDARVKLNKLEDDSYNNHNLVMSAIPKAISAQLQGFASDENILRLVSTQNTYYNLLTYALHGSLDENGNKVDLADSISGCDVTNGNTYSVYDLISGEETPDKKATDNPIGHYIISHLFNQLPPVGDRLGGYQDTDSLWTLANIDGIPHGDTVVLSNAAAITNTINLQFILKTKMTLISRDGEELNRTGKSPAHAEEGEVQILFNLLFDRPDTVYDSSTSLTVSDEGTEITADFANYSTLSIPSGAINNGTTVDVGMAVVEKANVTNTSFVLKLDDIDTDVVVEEYLTPIVELTPHNTNFNEDVSLEIPYSTAGLVEGQTILILKLSDDTEQQWNVIGSFDYDPDDLPIATIDMNSFSYLTFSTYETTGAPPPPQSITLGTVTHNSVSLSWPLVSGNPNKYTIVTSDPNLPKQNTTNLSYTYSGLQSNTEYTFSVASVSTAEIEGSARESSSIVTGPGAVQNLTSSNITNNRVSVSWDTANGATRYLLNSTGPITGYYVNEPTTSQLVQGLTGNTEYTLSVQSLRGNGVNTVYGDTTSTISIKTAPDPVLNLSTSNVKDNTIQLSWDAPSTGGVSTYRIVPTGGSLSNVSVSAPTTTYKFDNIPPNTSYDFTVVSINSDGLVGGSASLTGVMTGPAPVNNLTNTSGTDTSLTLEWIGSAGANLYSVTDGSNIQTTNSSNITISNLTANTYYDITVTAYNDAVQGGSSTLTNLITAPAAVNDLAISNLTGPSLTLSWTGADGATKYQIITDDGTNQTTVETANTYYDFTGLQTATTYDFTVTSYNGDNLVGGSTTLNDVFTSPSAVTDLTVGTVTDTTIYLSWTGANGANNYYVTNGSDTQTTTSNNITFNGLTANTYYTLKVTSYIGNEIEGSNVSTAPILTAPAAITGLTSSDIDHVSLTLSWTGVDGATDYYISESNLTTRVVQGTSNTFDGLVPNTTYNFTIKSYNGDLEGGSLTSGNITTAPAAVTGLTGSDVDHDSLTLSWTGADGAVGYKLTPTAGSNTFTPFVITSNTFTFSGLNANELHICEVVSINSDGIEGGSATLSGSPTHSYSSTVNGFNDITVRNGYLYDTSSTTYGAQVFSQLTDWVNVIETSSTKTGEIKDSDERTGSFIDMNIPSEIQASVTASYQEGFYLEVQVNNSSITHINPSKFRFLQNDIDRVTPNNIMLIGKELPSSQWTYIKEKTNIDETTDWIDTDTISVSGKFSIFRIYLDASDWGSRGVTMTDFDIIGDGYLRSRDAGKGILTAPGVPTGLQYTDRTEDSITLQWNSVDGANAYSVTNGSSTKFVSTTNTIIYDQLDGNTSYDFTVTSYNDALAGGTSSITNSTTAPDEPANVQNPTVTDTTATLTWNVVDGASKYVVTNGTSTQNTNTNSIIFSGLTGNTTYNFTITSYNGDVLEGGSYLKSGILTAPTVVTGLSSSSIDHDSISLSWTGADGATDYYISEPNLTTEIVQGTSKTFNGLVPNTTYNFTIKSYNGDLEGDSVTSGNITTAPAAVTGLTGSDVDHDSLTLSWTGADGAVGYKLTPTAGSNTFTPFVITSNTFTFSGLNANELHICEVVSINSDGIEGGSATLSGSPTHSYSSTVNGFNDITVRNGYLYDTSSTTYGAQVFSQLTDWVNVIETSSTKTGEIKDSDERTGSFIDMNIPSEIQASVTASYQEGFYLEVQVNNSSITHINPSKFRFLQNDIDRVTPNNIMLIGKELPSSQWTYIKEKTNIDETTDWIDTDTISVSGKFSIFRIYLDASDWGSRGVTMTDFDIIGDGYLRSRDAGKGILTAPGVPTGLQYTDRTEDSITLQWNSVDGANAYSVTNGSSTKFVSTTNTIIYDQLDGNTSYDFTVTSYNDALAGGTSSITNSTTAPDEPANVQNPTVTDTTATLTWNVVDGASKYVVTNGTSTQNTNTNSIIFSGLTGNTTYNFTITSYNGDVLEGGSYLKSGILTAPTVVTGLSSSSIDHDSISLSWTGADGATDYYISEPNLTTEIVQGTSKTFDGLDPNTTYNFTITSYNGTLVGGNVSTGNIITAPGVVIGFNYTNLTSTSVDLSWSAPTNGASTYDIIYGATTINITGTSKTISGLQPGNNYNFQLKALNSNGLSGVAASINNVVPPPEAVTGLTSSGIDHDSITLSWSGATSATDYYISESNLNTEIVQGTTKTFNGLGPNTTYNFTITSYNGGLEGESTTSGNITTAPAGVSGLASSGVDETSLTLSWTGADGADKYVITSGGALTSVTINEPSASHEFTGLTPSTTYNFAVTSYNGDLEGGSNIISVTTDTEVVARAASSAQIQSSESVVGVTWNTINTEWTAGSNAVSYSLSTSPSVSGYPKNTSDTSHEFTGLNENTTYTFTITSLNNLGNEGESTTITETTAPGKVSDITVTAVAYNNVDLSWTGASGANNYVISDGVNTQNTNTNSVTFTGLTANTEYNFTITSYRDLIEGRGKTVSSVVTGPEAVTNFAAGEVTQNTIPLTWTEEPTANNYSLQISDGATTTSEVLTGNSYTASNLDPNTSYTFSLQSKGYSDQTVEYYKYYGFRITLGSKSSLSNPLHLKRLKIFDDNGDELTSFTAEIIGDVPSSTHGELKNRDDNNLDHNLSSGDVTTKLQTDGSGQINGNDVCISLAVNGNNSSTNRRKILLTFADGAKPSSYQYDTDIGFTPLNWMVFGSNTKSKVENANHNTTDVLIHEKDYGRFNRYERNRIVPWAGGFANSGNTIYTDSSGTEYSSSGTGRVLIYKNNIVYSSPYFWVWLRKKHPYSSYNDQNATLESDDFNLYKLGDMPPFIGETSGNTVSINVRTASEPAVSKIIFLDSFSEIENGNENTGSSDLELGKAQSSSDTSNANDNKVLLNFKINEDLTKYNNAVIQFTSETTFATDGTEDPATPTKLKIYVDGNSSTFIKWNITSDWQTGNYKYYSVDIFSLISSFTGTDLTLVIEGQSTSDNEENQANEGRQNAHSGSGTNDSLAPQLILSANPINAINLEETTSKEILYSNGWQDGQLTYSTQWHTTSYNGVPVIDTNSSDLELGYGQGPDGTDNDGPPLPAAVILNFGPVYKSISELTKIVFTGEPNPGNHENARFPVNLKLISSYSNSVIDWVISNVTSDDKYETPDITELLNPDGSNEIEIRSTNTDQSDYSRISMVSSKIETDTYTPRPFVYSIAIANPVTNLSVATYWWNSIRLTWAEAAGANTYSIQTSPASSDGTQTFTAPIGDNVKITGLEPNTEYTFTVTSINAAGQEGGVSTIVDTTGPYAYGLTSSNVTVSKTDTTITATWPESVNEGVVSYNAYIRLSTASVWTLVSSGLSASATTYTFSGLSASTEYNVRIHAMGEDNYIFGNGFFSVGILTDEPIDYILNLEIEDSDLAYTEDGIKSHNFTTDGNTYVYSRASHIYFTPETNMRVQFTLSGAGGGGGVINSTTNNSVANGGDGGKLQGEYELYTGNTYTAIVGWGGTRGGNNMARYGGPNNGPGSRFIGNRLGFGGHAMYGNDNNMDNPSSGDNSRPSMTVSTTIKTSGAGGGLTGIFEGNYLKGKDYGDFNPDNNYGNDRLDNLFNSAIAIAGGGGGGGQRSQGEGGAGGIDRGSGGYKFIDGEGGFGGRTQAADGVNSSGQPITNYKFNNNAVQRLNGGGEGGIDWVSLNNSNGRARGEPGGKLWGGDGGWVRQPSGDKKFYGGAGGGGGYYGGGGGAAKSNGSGGGGGSGYTGGLIGTINKYTTPAQEEARTYNSRSVKNGPGSAGGNRNADGVDGKLEIKFLDRIS